ncbi:MAG TPA: ATP phosphoribosyltransferase [bacterium]|nr:ATP phosphoribosyltransferase [bacterium]
MTFQETQRLRLGIPKGSLQESTLTLFARAGFNIVVNGRSYFPTCNDEEIAPVLLRAQEIPRYVADGVLDAGITGHDWVVENKVDVIEVAELVYAKQSMRPVRWVLAVHENDEAKSVRDLEGKTIATEVVNITRDYLASHGVNAKVEFSWGATEVKVPHLVDAIVDVTETGSSLRENNLRIVDTVLESTTRLIANRESMRDEVKSRKIEDLAILLQGAIRAWGRVLLRMKVPQDRLPAVLGALPLDPEPDVYAPDKSGNVIVNAVMDKGKARRLSPELRRLGAFSLVEFAVNQLID